MIQSCYCGNWRKESNECVTVDNWYNATEELVSELLSNKQKDSNDCPKFSSCGIHQGEIYREAQQILVSSLSRMDGVKLGEEEDTTDEDFGAKGSVQKSAGPNNLLCRNIVSYLIKVMF